MTAAPESVQALRIAARAAADKHATQLNAYDVSEAMGLIDGFLLAFITTQLAGLPSAWRASRMNIVDALRHQA